MTLRVVCLPVTDLSQRFIFPYPAGDMVIRTDGCSSWHPCAVYLTQFQPKLQVQALSHKDSAEMGSGLLALRCPCSTKLGFAEVFLCTDIPSPTVLPQDWKGPLPSLYCVTPSGSASVRWYPRSSFTQRVECRRSGSLGPAASVMNGSFKFALEKKKLQDLHCCLHLQRRGTNFSHMYFLNA